MISMIEGNLPRSRIRCTGGSPKERQKEKNETIESHDVWEGESPTDCQKK